MITRIACSITRDAMCYLSEEDADFDIAVRILAENLAKTLSTAGSDKTWLSIRSEFQKEGEKMLADLNIKHIKPHIGFDPEEGFVQILFVPSNDLPSNFTVQ